MSGKGKVYLVGAGPGDAGLITLKGLKSIQKADVIVYDRLVSRRLLSHAGGECEMIYAGKAPGRHVLNQEEINQTLVEHANKGLVVTRLKGGDPFIFGRGGEEAEALFAAGIPFEIVPGVTASIAVPAYAGIPLTHRKKNSSLTIVTGNEDPLKECSKIPWAQLPEMRTLVFMMGLRNLPKITARLVAEGMNPETPVAVVQWGTTPEQKTVQGTISTIAEIVAQEHIKHPSVIVVGETVDLRQRLKWVEHKPLFGRRILLVQQREYADDLADKIEELGGEPVIYSTFETAAAPLSHIKRVLEQTADGEWLLFTGHYEVRYFCQGLMDLGMDIRSLAGLKIAAVNGAIADILKGYGVRADLVFNKQASADLLNGINEHGLDGKRVIIPGNSAANNPFAADLETAGVQIEELVVYQTAADTSNCGQLMEQLQQNKIFGMLLADAISVKHFGHGFSQDELSSLFYDVVITCSGTAAASAAAELGIRVDAVVEENTAGSLLQAFNPI